MDVAAIIDEFEGRTGFVLPEPLRAAMMGQRDAFITHEYFADPILFGPLGRGGATGSRLEDFGYTLQVVDNYDGYVEPYCLVTDPFQLGDEIFLVGRDGRFDPALMFLDHETCEVIELAPDIGEALQYAQ